MDPITMMVASVGLQFFNNYATSNKNREIQAKQREFQRATAEHDFERARKVQAEAARIALELEAEVHQERVEDIQKNYDSLLENFAHGFAISNWPLNVLPFVMKGESFGSLIGGTAKSISMHCVFTPSNCAWFNECFYDEIDSRVEAEMNNNWNSQSTHPIVYYGGGWNRRESKHGISIPSLIDLDDIALLKNKLKNIPTMVITPFFDPYLHFKVQLWGMGQDSDMPFRIDIPNNETEVHNRIFTFDYNKDSTPEFSENFYCTTTKEFVAYVVKLAGFVADKYFWSIYGAPPVLPIIAKRTNLLFCNPEELKREYLSLVEHHNDEFIVTNRANNRLAYINNIFTAATNREKIPYVLNLLCQVCNSRNTNAGCTNDNIENTLSATFFSVDDIQFLEEVASILEPIHNEKTISIHTAIKAIIKEIIDQNETSIHYTFSYISMHGLLSLIIKEFDDVHDEATLILELFPEKHIVSLYFVEKGDETICLKDGFVSKINIKVYGLLVPKEFKEQNPKRIKIKKCNIRNLMNSIAFNCDFNIFHSIITIEKIFDYCTRVANDVKLCNLYIKEALPKDVIKDIDSNILSNIMYCEIIDWNNDSSHQIFYFDEIGGELKEKFNYSNVLTIE